jgi:hypothetical protein
MVERVTGGLSFGDGVRAGRSLRASSPRSSLTAEFSNYIIYSMSFQSPSRRDPRLREREEFPRSVRRFELPWSILTMPTRTFQDHRIWEPMR